MASIPMNGFVFTGPVWNWLQISGGGNVIGLDINSDGTFLSWGDVFGGWISSTVNAGSNGNWQQLFSATSMPGTNLPRTYWTGIYYAKSAPTNSNTIVALYCGNFDSSGSAVIISRNKGATWSRISGITSSIPASNGSTDGYWAGMVVFNPSSDAEFYIGVPGGGGIWHCTSYGSSCMRLDPGTIPAASSGFGYYGMAWQGSNILIPVYGTGAYISTNGGSTWGASSGAPTEIFSGGYAADGTYFSLNYNSQSGANVYRLTTGGIWSQIGPGSQWWNGLAIDPNNKDHIAVITFAGETDVSTNATGSATWQGGNSAFTINNGDTPWIGWSFGGSFTFLNCNNCLFDYSGNFWVSMGIGILYATSLPSSGNTTYIPMTQGSEGLQGNWARWVPGGPVLLSAWDRPIWVITDPNSPQSTHAPTTDGDNVYYGDGLDYAQNNASFFVGDRAGALYYSSNAGGNWSAISSQPLSGNSCALAVFSSTQWIVVDNGNGNVSVTANGGSSWTTTPTGLPSGGFKFGDNGHTVCWDSVTAGTGYIVSTAGTVYSTTNYGSSWSQVSSTAALPAVTTPARLKAVPGQPGHLFFTAGNPSNAPSGQPASTTAYLYFSSNGGATWTAVTNSSYLLTSAWDVGISGAAPGQNYPSIAVFGWMKTASTGGIYVLDVWRCDNFNPSSMSGIIWTEMNWPWVSEPACVEGNPYAYNEWVIANNAGGSGMGFQYFGPKGVTWG